VPIPVVSRQFDEIAVKYDETRDPMEASVVAEMVRQFREAGIEALLEVGVGTGRVSGPLTEAGLRMTGVDGSQAMLARARQKTRLPLVRGDAYHLPFLDRSFDGALFVHVLHLLDDPRAALAEAIRASRRCAFAIVRPGVPGEEPRNEGAEAPRRIVYRELARLGYPIPERARGPGAGERRVLKEIPPDRLDILDDREVTESADQRLRMLERGASRHTMHIPSEVLSRAVATAREEIGGQSVTYRRIEALARWSALPAPNA
jgi:SAM-dependent methyltransferase